MNTSGFLTASPLAIETAVLVLLLSGLALVWRGLRGSWRGRGGSMVPATTMLARMEGFRLVVFGLVCIGLALALHWHARWLLWLALGIGFVEIVESSTLIAVWRRNPVGRPGKRNGIGSSP